MIRPLELLRKKSLLSIKNRFDIDTKNVYVLNHGYERMKDEGRRMKDETGRDLRERTKAFALRIVRLYVALPKTTEAQVIGKQVLRSGTSIGAHYREASRARSDAEFVSKIGIALQELYETSY